MPRLNTATLLTRGESRRTNLCGQRFLARDYNDFEGALEPLTLNTGAAGRTAASLLFLGWSALLGGEQIHADRLKIFIGDSATGAPGELELGLLWIERDPDPVLVDFRDYDPDSKPPGCQASAGAE